ncbi:hypothetical protein KAT08_03070 [Candidatus Babeliales bacterium]|nr:hypothetical protein [Candidatus Babeliales bacterium]
MGNKVFFFIFISCFYFSSCFLNNFSSNQIQDLISSLEIFNNNDECNKDSNQNKSVKKDKRWFKKRYLLSVLGILGFLGISFGFSFKMFDWFKNSSKDIEGCKDNLSDFKKENNEKIDELNCKIEKIADCHKQSVQQIKDEFMQDSEKNIHDFEQKVEKLKNDMKKTMDCFVNDMSDVLCKINDATYKNKGFFDNLLPSGVKFSDIFGLMENATEFNLGIDKILNFFSSDNKKDDFSDLEERRERLLKNFYIPKSSVGVNN